MGRVRPFQPADIPQVIALNTKLFPFSSILSYETQEKTFNEVCFRNPWYDPEIGSLVYEDSNGKIVAFFGIVPRRMTVNGQPIRVGVGQHLMADNAPLANLHLYKAWVAGPQELSIADNCTDYTRKLMETVGGTPALMYGFWWKKMLRPTSYAVSRILKRKSLSAASAIMRPIATGVDRLIGLPFVKQFHIPKPETTGEELTVATMLANLTKFTDGRPVVPAYTEEWLTWLFEVLGRERRFGKVRKLAVKSKDGTLIGWYVYYLKPGGKSEVLQIAASKRTISDVLDHLFYDAWNNGAAELSGRVDPVYLKAFTEHYCFFVIGNDWMVLKSGMPDLVGTINGGGAFLSRLEGDLWFF